MVPIIDRCRYGLRELLRHHLGAAVGPRESRESQNTFLFYRKEDILVCEVAPISDVLIMFQTWIKNQINTKDERKRKEEEKRSPLSSWRSSQLH
jgi:hypothetical protein